MKRLLLIAAASMALLGCASAPLDIDDLPPDTGDQAIRSTHDAADTLSASLRRAGFDGSAVLVASVAQVDSLSFASTLGKMLGEQISARLAAQGFPVVEVKLRSNLLLSARGGEFVLSRETKEISQAHRAGVVVAGTYAASGSHVMVTVKAIDAESGRIITGTSYSIPRSELRGLVD